MLVLFIQQKLGFFSHLNLYFLYKNWSLLITPKSTFIQNQVWSTKLYALSSIEQLRVYHTWHCYNHIISKILIQRIISEEILMTQIDDLRTVKKKMMCTYVTIILLKYFPFPYFISNSNLFQKDYTEIMQTFQTVTTL